MKTPVILLGLVGLALGRHSQDDIDSGKVLQDLGEKALQNAMQRLERSNDGCTAGNVRVRKEWRNIPEEERIDFVRAVGCLMDTESLYPEYDGAKSRFDDFGVVHYELTSFVHFSGSFLLFHRIYVWAFEQALRTECGFKGTFPYWNWGEDAGDIEKSPLFDGSPTSIGSNGAWDPDWSTAFAGVPRGSGGGCLMKGPFSDRQVNLGPFGKRHPLRHNPRCIRRDLNTFVTQQWASFRNVTEVILRGDDIARFQALLEADPREEYSASLFLGVHGGGHHAVGGDPGGDFHWSPLDPSFYLHHAGVDRMYFVWQNLDWEDRQNVSGSRTLLNAPPTAPHTLTDEMDISPLAASRTLGELIDTVGDSPFCYVYE